MNEEKLFELNQLENKLEEGKCYITAIKNQINELLEQLSGYERIISIKDIKYIRGSYTNDEINENLFLRKRRMFLIQQVAASFKDLSILLEDEHAVLESISEGLTKPSE